MPVVSPAEMHEDGLTIPEDKNNPGLYLWHKHYRKGSSLPKSLLFESSALTGDTVFIFLQGDAGVLKAN